jgi:hypothetical protein
VEHFVATFTSCLLRLGDRTIRIYDDSYRGRLRNQLSQEPKPLRHQVNGEQSHFGDIAARAAEDCDEIVDVAPFAARTAGGAFVLEPSGTR